MKALRFIFTIGLPLLIFCIITVNVISNNTNYLDNYVYQRISSFISPNLTDLMKLITFFGSSQFLTVVALILIFVFIKSEKHSFNAAMIVINLLLSAILNVGIKYAILRERPDVLRLIEISGYSFPSGHSMVSMSFYGLLIYLCFKNYKKRWKPLIISMLAIIILFIGISRIYLGVHYTSDVLGGFFLGITWIGIYSSIVDIRYKKKYANI